MYGLDVERLLDFGVWSDEEMKENHFSDAVTMGYSSFALYKNTKLIN
jgi:hypothetical protein